MRKMQLALALAVLAACSAGAIAQTSQPSSLVLLTGDDAAQSGRQPDKGTVPLDAQQEKAALRIFLKDIQHQIVSTAEAMPATKYEFTPNEGEFKGVRTFARQVRHLSATNHILAAAALGEKASADIDENGPESVRTKAEVLDYLNTSFEHLGKAIDAIGDSDRPVKSSPISPLPANKTTRLALTVEALIHAFNHYGQMVEYLRMNGIVPPSSRP